MPQENKLSRTGSDTRGFTIIELLIATVVFSVVMLIAAAAVIYVSKTYIKGQVESQTQQTAQDIVSTIAQDIHDNRNSTIIIPSESGSNHFDFCIGNHVYDYQLDYELSSLSGPMYSPHDLVVYPFSGTSCPTPPTSFSSLTYGGETQEMLSAHQRLGQLSLVCDDLIGGSPWVPGDPCPNATYSISVIVAYGDDDVLSDLSPRQPTPAGGQWSPADSFTYHCVQQSYGGNFCAVSSLTTTAISSIN